MQYRVLGRTGIVVSRLCFGALTIGPLQTDLSVTEGARIIRRALAAGVNFIDTADLYGTYPHIRQALQGYSGDVVIGTKCYAYTYDDMRKCVERALKLTGRDYIDIFMLHEQESILTIRGHWEAMEYLLEAKDRGIIRAVGISTHHVQGVMDAAAVPEIEVIHSLFNITGIGIRGGTRDDMLRAIGVAAKAGKGIYGMKALGGGNLLKKPEESFDFVMAIPELSSVAVGMSTIAEVDFNTRYFSGQPVSAGIRALVRNKPRRLHIEDWCLGCGQCAERCRAGALTLSGGKAVVDSSLCSLCGYCGSVCPDFCIKVI